MTSTCMGGARRCQRPPPLARGMVIIVGACAVTAWSASQLSGDQAGWESLNREVEQLAGQGQVAQAIERARESLKVAIETFGPAHPNVAYSTAQLGFGYWASLQFKEAMTLFDRAASIYEGAVAQDCAVAGGLSQFAIAAVAHLSPPGTPDPVEGEALLTRALAAIEGGCGEGSAQTVALLKELGALHSINDRVANAGLFHQRALEIQERELGPHHPEVVKIMNSLASDYQRESKLAEAAAMLERVVAIKEQQSGPQAAELTLDLRQLAQVYEALGQPQKADTYARRASAIEEHVFGTRRKP